MPRTPDRAIRNRAGAERRGRFGERLAALFLQCQWYRILHRRYKTPVGEIDLVAERFGTLVFVEVKTRGSSAVEAEALEAVNTGRIVRAAEFFLARHPARAERDIRFDVIFVAPFAWPRHITNAFTA